MLHKHDTSKGILSLHHWIVRTFIPLFDLGSLELLPYMKYTYLLDMYIDIYIIEYVWFIQSYA
jgi:hypothetical protein